MARISLNKNSSRDIRPAVRRDLLKRSKVKRRRQRLKRVYVLIFAIAALVVFGVVLLNRPALKIDRILVQGNKVVLTTEVEQVAAAELEGAYWYLIPKKSFFFYPAKQIEQVLEHRYPRIGVATVTTHKLRTLIVDIKERSADSLWCTTSLEAGKSCYFTDPTGLIISKAPQFSGRVYFEVYGEAIANPVGTRPIPEAAFKTIVVFSKTLPEVFSAAEIKATPERANALAEGDYELSIKEKDKTWKIIFNVNQQSSDLIAHLSTTLRSEAFLNDYHNTRLTLKQIDLRFGKKIFYKFE